MYCGRKRRGGKDRQSFATKIEKESKSKSKVRSRSWHIGRRDGLTFPEFMRCAVKYEDEDTRT